MSDLQICRICLRIGCKMYRYDQFKLKLYYEDILATELTLPDGLPCCFCYECAALIYKFHKFKIKCNNGQNTLKARLLTGKVSYEAIKKIDRRRINLSFLEVLKVSDRVQTFVQKDSKYVEEDSKYVVKDSKCVEKDSKYVEKDSKHVKKDSKYVKKDSKHVESDGESSSESESTENSDEEMTDAENYDEEMIDSTELVNFENYVDAKMVFCEEKSVERNIEILNEEILKECKNIKVINTDDKMFFCKDSIEKNIEILNEEILKECSNIKSINSDDDLIDFHDAEISDEEQLNPDEEINTLNNSKTIAKDQSNEIKIENEIVISDDENEPLLKKILKNVKGKNIKQVNQESKDTTSNKNKWKKINFKYAKPTTSKLDASAWKRYLLCEEDAWKEFHALAADPKYVAAEHKCAKCHTWFRTRDKLKRHIVLKHESRGTLECKFCLYRFKVPCEVQRHVKKHYKRFECLKCGMKTGCDTSAILHQDVHTGARYRCNQCDLSFRHCSTYYTHLRTHRSDILCTICGDSFLSKLGLYIHKKAKHCTGFEEEEESDDDDTSVNTYCETCSIRFQSRRAYIEHMFNSAAHSEGAENLLKPVRDPGRRKVTGKIHKAEIVSMLKGRKDGDDWRLDKMRRHYKRRLKKKPTTCNQCGESFETQAACMKHHRKEHPGTTFESERHICEICGANLAQGSIKMHQNMHSHEVMHTCETCGRSFHSKISLKRHYLVHTGEKPHKCPLCDKRYTQYNSMKLHYKTFHLKEPYPKRNRRKKEPVEIEPDPANTAVGTHTVTGLG